MMVGASRYSSARKSGISKRIALWILLCGLVGAGLPARASADAGILSRYPLSAAPFDIAVESSSRVWFTLPEANAIGSLELTGTEPVYREYPLPAADSEPYRLVVAAGQVWFTQRQGNRIGRLTIADGSLVEYPVPTAASQPTGIDVAPDGRVWFAESAGNQLAVLTPATGTIVERPTGRTNTQLDRVNAQSAGVVWATAPGINLLFGYRLANADFISVSLEDTTGAQGSLRGLAVSNIGVPWVSTRNIAKVGSYLYGTLAIWLWYRYSPTTADLVDLVWADVAGAPVFWGVDAARKELVQIDAETLGVRHRMPVGGNASQLSELAFDPTGGVAWVADPGTSSLYSWQAPYSLKTYLPVIDR
jgi:streptogramin lyase